MSRHERTTLNWCQSFLSLWCPIHPTDRLSHAMREGAKLSIVQDMTAGLKRGDFIKEAGLSWASEAVALGAIPGATYLILLGSEYSKETTSIHADLPHADLISLSNNVKDNELYLATLFSIRSRNYKSTSDLETKMRTVITTMQGWHRELTNDTICRTLGAEIQLWQQQLRQLFPHATTGEAKEASKSDSPGSKESPSFSP